MTPRTPIGAPGAVIALAVVVIAGLAGWALWQAMGAFVNVYEMRMG